MITAIIIYFVYFFFIIFIILLLFLLLFFLFTYYIGGERDNSRLKVDSDGGNRLYGHERKIIDDGCFPDIFITDD